MSIETAEELERMRAVGRVVARAMRAMREEVRAGVTTGELDEVGAKVFRAAGARSGPQLDYGFPASTASASTTRRCTGSRASGGCATATW